MEQRTCKFCNETFPLTGEHFYHNKKNGKKYYHHKCKECFNYEKKINYQLNMLEKEREQKEAWKKEFEDKTFICAKCRQEKTGKEMKLDSTNTRMDRRCRDCYNKIHRENYARNYRANVFGKVLADQRRMKNDNDNSK